MLTAEEVRSVTFRKANLGGCRPEDVEAFKEEVAETLEQYKRDKIDLVKKLDILAKRIEEYRKDEENVRGALLNAQKVMDSTVKEANAKAEEIIKNAQLKAQDIVVGANASVVKQKNDYLKLQADAVVLREQLLETYNSHIRMLEDLPTAKEIGNKKAQLDRDYPTSDAVYAPVKEEQPKQEEAPAQEEEVVDISSQTSASAAEPTKEAVEKENKFSDLKFGENYSMTDQPDKKTEAEINN